MTDRPLRIGMIGASWGLVGHLPAWRNLPGVEVVAICTAHEETAKKAAADHGIPRAYWDYREMVKAHDLDIIDIGTRPSIRHDMVRAALAAGKHVVNANPFVLTLEQADATLAAQRAAGVIGVVECQFQWLPQFSQMKRMIDQGFLGQLYGVEVRCQFPLIRDGEAAFPFMSRPGYTTYNWLAERASGASTLRNLGGHCLHALVHLFGEVAEVSAELETFLKEWRYADGQALTPEPADTAFVNLRFAGGGLGQLNLSSVVPDARGFSLEAFGSNGRIRMQSTSGFPDAPNTRLFAAPAAARGMNELLEKEITPDADLWTASGREIVTPPGARVVVPLTRMLDSMVRTIREGGEPQPSFAQARHVHAVVEAAERSSEEGRRMKVS
jgi:predicted dehydrogenase